MIGILFFKLIIYIKYIIMSEDMFKSTNNYKDYFFHNNNGQSLPLMSLILVPAVTLFLSYTTLISKSEKNKKSVTDNLESLNNDNDIDSPKTPKTPKTPVESIEQQGGKRKVRKTKKMDKRKNRKTKRR